MKMPLIIIRTTNPEKYDHLYLHMHGIAVEKKMEDANFNPEFQSLDITGADNIEVVVRNDGKVLWVNVDGRCMLRVCRINGKVEIMDHRRKL